MEASAALARAALALAVPAAMLVPPPPPPPPSAAAAATIDANDMSWNPYRGVGWDLWIWDFGLPLIPLFYFVASTMLLFAFGSLLVLETENETKGPPFTAVYVFVTLLSLWLLWVIPAAQVVIEGNILYRFRKTPRSMADKEFSQVQGPGNTSRRWCERCNAPQGDRVYHKKAGLVDACFPLYDHYCGMYSSPIYLYNKKAYLLSLIFMPLHIIVQLTIAIWAWTTQEYEWRHRLLPFAAALVPFGFLVGDITYLKWRTLAAGNGLSEEIEKKDLKIFIAAKSRFGSPIFLDAKDRHIRCWDLGTSRNLHDGLGSRWTWFLSLIPAPQIQTWEQDCDESDWPMSEELMAWATRKRTKEAKRKGRRLSQKTQPLEPHPVEPAHLRRSSQLAQSSGFEQEPVEMAHLRRREPTHSEEQGTS